MRLLILGGTAFLGRAIADAALRRGDQVTLFHRGKTNPDLFPRAEHVLGDRDGGLDALVDRTFDACVDTSGYFPRVVRASAQCLGEAVGRYVFVSSLSVYAPPLEAVTDEAAPVGTLEDPLVEEITGETYGPLKALCEAAVEEVFEARALVVRPGLIVGPHDPTDRMSYWPWRIAQGGETLAPGRPDRAIQMIDVRDLAEWILSALDQGISGTFNATSMPGDLTMEAFLTACQRVSGSDATLRWIDDAFLIEQEAGGWVELPLWIPESDPMAQGFFGFTSTKAVGQGMTFRPLEETIRDTLNWLATRPKDHAWRAGTARDKEQRILEHWAAA